MTAVCGGGTSAVKPGLEAVVDYSAGLTAAILQLRGLKWAIPVLPLANIPTLTLANFCASDPPAMPTFTSAETAAVLGLNFGADFDSGVAKFRDMILHALWYDACECTSGALDTFPTVTIPTGTPIFQPPVPAVVEPCWTDAITTFTRNSGGPTFAGFITHGGAYGLDITLAQVTMTITALTGNFNVTVEIRQQATDPVVTGHTYSYNRGVGTTTVTVPWDPLYPQWAIYLTGQTGTGNRDVDVSSAFYCGGQQPGGELTPCCPPDSSTQAYLDLLIKMVTLIQRQAVPFAYVYGSNHTGLTDDGEVSPVSGLVGVSVDVTTLPSSYGRSVGTPERLFDLGFVTLGTADGWADSRRIDADGTLLIPAARAGIFTRIGYTLSPGVVVDIRELVREP